MEKSRAKRRTAARDIAYTALGVALITVCAWISVPVGEVPFTLQTFAVAAAGSILGVRRGCAAVLVYVLMGLVGIPVFAGFQAGVPALMGATGGYILGFLFAALLPALFSHIPVKNRIARAAVLYCGMMLGLAICYLFGTVWFLLVYNNGVADPIGVGAALSLCVIPYLIPDAVKLFLAALLSARLKDVMTK